MSQAATRPRELSASLDEVSVTVEPVLETCAGDGATVWRVRGRSNVALAAVASWVPDDAYGEAELTSERAFTIAFRDPSEQNTMASGLPIFVTLTPVDGAPLEAAIWFRPRVQAGAGAGLVRFYATVKPVWLAGDVEYRGKLAVTPPWSVQLVSAPAPRTVPLDPGTLRLAWTFDELAATLHRAPSAELLARAQRGEAVAERRATLQVRATRVGLTRRDPREVWPTVCEERVRACLAALPAGELDTEACGTYRQVLACGGPTTE